MPNYNYYYSNIYELKTVLHLYRGDEEELEAFDDAACAVTDWEPWSECTALCGEGLKMRKRSFVQRTGFKKCPHVSLVEKEKCMEPPCTFNELVRTVGLGAENCNYI